MATASNRMASALSTRRKNHGDALLPAVDNTHMVWLEKEKERWLQEKLITPERHRALATGLDFAHGALPCEGPKDTDCGRDILDVFIKPDGCKFPSLIIMSGTRKQLQLIDSEKRKWVRKGKGEVKKIILLIWYIQFEGIIPKIGGQMEIYSYDKDLKRKRKPIAIDFVPMVEDRIEFIIPLRLGDLYGRNKSSRRLIPKEEAGIQINLNYISLCIEAFEAIHRNKFEPLYRFDVKRCRDDDTASISSGNTTIVETRIYNFNDKIFGNSPTNEGPKTHTDIQTTVHSQLIEHKSFLPTSSEEIEKTSKQITEKTARNIQPTLNNLGLETPDILSLATVSLFDVYMMCDDSGSMAYGGRYDLLKDTVRRIAPVVTSLSENGVSIRYINYVGDHVFNNLSSPEDVDRTLAMVAPSGDTPIGTRLSEKIVQPLLQKARQQELNRPVLILIITDGEPTESTDTLKNVIRECKDTMVTLRSANDISYKRSSVIFQINYVGDQPEAEEFVKGLANDPELRGVVYCNLKKIDAMLMLPSEGEINRSILEVLRSAIETNKR